MEHEKAGGSGTENEYKAQGSHYYSRFGIFANVRPGLVFPAGEILPTHHRIFFYTSLTAFGLLLSLLLIELAFRLFPSERFLTRFAPDRPARYYFPEDSAGNIDRAYPSKKESAFRIAVVGDSFAFGFGNQFDDAFPKRLERLLNLNTGQRKAEVINFSVPSYSAADEKLLVEKAVEFSPDLILLEITLNDGEIVPFEFNSQDFRKSVHPGPVSGGIYEYWKSLAFVVNRFRNAMADSGYRNYFIRLFTDPEKAARFGAALDRMKETSAKNNATFAAVIFPLFSYPLDDSYPFQEIHKTISGMLKERNIPYLDLLTKFKGMDPRRLQVLPGKDPHPNEIAHRVAAESIYRWIAHEKMIPGDLIVKNKSDHRDGPKTMAERYEWIKRF